MRRHKFYTRMPSKLKKGRSINLTIVLLMLYAGCARSHIYKSLVQAQFMARKGKFRTVAYQTQTRDVEVSTERLFVADQLHMKRLLLMYSNAEGRSLFGRFSDGDGTAVFSNDSNFAFSGGDVYGSVPVEDFACSPEKSPLNTWTPSGCKCDVDFFGADCSVLKADYCCSANSKSPLQNMCPFRRVSERSLTRRHARAWCGGHNVECEFDDDLRIGRCKCPAGYSGLHCELSACHKFGDCGFNLARGACSVDVETGTPHCDCLKRFPHYFTGSKCERDIGSDAEAMRECGVKSRQIGPNLAEWDDSSRCNGHRGICVGEGDGCKCFDQSSDVTRTCSESECGRCDPVGTRECNKTANACVCFDTHTGLWCDEDLCERTGGQVVRQGECKCPSITNHVQSIWKPNFGCCVELPSCGHTAAKTQYGHMQLTKSARNTRLLFEKTCKCERIVDPKARWVQELDSTSDVYPGCKPLCFKPRVWRDGECV